LFNATSNSTLLLLILFIRGKINRDKLGVKVVYLRGHLTRVHRCKWVPGANLITLFTPWDVSNILNIKFWIKASYHTLRCSWKFVVKCKKFIGMPPVSYLPLIKVYKGEAVQAILCFVCSKFLSSSLWAKILIMGNAKWPEKKVIFFKNIKCCLIQYVLVISVPIETC
jgi:hypothetical protein